MQRTILLCLMVIFVTAMAAETQIDTFDKTAIDTPPGRLPQPTRDVPDYSFSTDPQAIQTTYFDYMPGSYNSCPVRVQTNNAMGQNGVYMLFHAMETANATRRENISYWNPVDQSMQTFYIGNVDSREGYGGLSIDFETQDPLCSWHIDLDANGVYECAFNYDMYHMLNQPGLIGTPFMVIPNEDWSGTGYTPPFPDDEFDWPYVFISEAPTYATDGKRRVFVIGNNHTSQSANPSENVLIAWADYTTADLDASLMADLPWTYTTIPMMDAWNAGPDWIRPFHCEAVSRDGKLAIIGHLAGDDPPINLAYPDQFILWNDNFGEGAWEYISINSEQWVDSPMNQPPAPVEPFFDSDSLHFTYTHSGHSSAVFDGEGRLHVPSCFALNGIDDTGSGIYYPWFMFMRDVVFDPSDGTFVTNNLYPQGTGPADVPYLPWDEDADGVVDEYSDEGFVRSVNGWPVAWYVADDAFHENNFKICSDPDHELLAAVWSDGLKSRFYNDAGDEDYVDWATAPEIFIAVSSDNGDTWTEPIELNALDTPELADMIPVYIYPGDHIEYLGNDIGRIHLFFLDDNSYGAFAQNGNGANDGGTMSYAAIDVEFPNVANNNNDIPAISGMLHQNRPNPFNPVTTIGFSLPVSGQVELAVYNVRGGRVKTLVNGDMKPGDHTVTWQGTDDNGSPVASGVYFYRLQAGGSAETRKMLLLK
ncbi:MAG: T9SS type A sorting domain-containing protein [Candidatus Cloacimonetes bacterium]|nr:T9SS type A sorting domain-containing protein [Candidatus Cloacimonadota bacterium]